VQALTWVGGSDAAVDVEDVAGALARARVGGKVQHRFRDVVGKHVDAERRACAVVLIEFVRGDAVCAGALLAPARAPAIDCPGPKMPTHCESYPANVWLELD
jgi:hypothetical protein